MKQVLLITGGVMLIIALIAGSFTFYQANREELSLSADLQYRTRVLADSLTESIAPSLTQGSRTTMQRTVDKMANNERITALWVFDGAGQVAAYAGTVSDVSGSALAVRAMDSDSSSGEFTYSGKEKVYVFVNPIHQEERVVGAIMVVEKADYIDEAVRSIWRENLLRLFLQLFLFAAVVFVLVRWIFFRSILKMVESLRAVRKGNSEIDEVPDTSFFEPLAGEISKVTMSLRQARHSASEEARMRLEKIDSPWTAERLKEFIKAYLKDRPIFVISNREPYVHSMVKGRVGWSVPAGGVVTALEPVMEACGGTWIAHGSGNADRETSDEDGKILVPPDEPKYTLKRVWLTEKEVQGYYTGFSNEALWPLCLMAHTRPLFRAEDWGEYIKVNAKFAKTLLDEIRHVERPIVLVQDYQLALVPEMIKKSRPDALVSLFWHIPWPSATQFNICPWRKELLLGMLGADLIGFHTQQHCNNFMDTVGNEIESRIDYEQFSVIRGAHQTAISPFPISIAFPGAAEARRELDKSILVGLGIESKHLVLGVDRLDYTKGILERFKGVEFLLDEHPEYRGTLTLLQIASPTRETVEKYVEYAARVTEEADRINKKFGTKDWKPIVLEKRNYSHESLIHLYQHADVCLITSLHDGMNLVAKEFAAARRDESGVLVLSQFAGASRDLKGALLINPYSAEETSAALHTALTMPKSEQNRRMKMMRASVRDYNIYRWSAELIKALSQLE